MADGVEGDEVEVHETERATGKKKNRGPRRAPKFVDLWDPSMNIFKFSPANATCNIPSKRRNIWISLPGHGVLH